MQVKCELLMLYLLSILRKTLDNQPNRQTDRHRDTQTDTSTLRRLLTRNGHLTSVASEGIADTSKTRPCSKTCSFILTRIVRTRVSSPCNDIMLISR